jgi:hypothetical protein
MIAHSVSPALTQEAEAPLRIAGMANWYWERAMFRILFMCALGVVGTDTATVEGVWAQPDDAPLRVEAKIPLGDVRGRIDHMAADIDRRRLFVAELGNNTVGIVDVGQGKILQVLAGLRRGARKWRQSGSDMGVSS